MTVLHRELIINGVRVPTRSMGPDFSQVYEEIHGVYWTRMASGRLVPQRSWPAAGRNFLLRTEISGSGRYPLALDGLDRGSAVEVLCAEYRMAGNSTTPLDQSITIPGAYRTDGACAPQGYALVERNGITEEESVEIASLVGGVATLQAHSGALGYAVRYYPIIVGAVTYKQSGSPHRGTRAWTLIAEEIGS